MSSQFLPQFSLVTPHSAALHFHCTYLQHYKNSKDNYLFFRGPVFRFEYTWEGATVSPIPPFSVSAHSITSLPPCRVHFWFVSFQINSTHTYTTVGMSQKNLSDDDVSMLSMYSFSTLSSSSGTRTPEAPANTVSTYTVSARRCRCTDKLPVGGDQLSI